MEIERRFLLRENVDSCALLASLPYDDIRQGYLVVDSDAISCVRVRVKGDKAFLTIKKEVSACSAEEFEYPIPYEDAIYMLDIMVRGYIVEKRRYYYTSAEGMCFEIDVFLRENSGLILVEVELPCEDYPLIIPDWLGIEITGERKYTNAMLSRFPFSLWEKM